MSDILDENLIPKDYEFKFKTWPLFIWMPILIIGILFRVMHWPGSAALILGSSSVITVYSITSLTRLKGVNIFNNLLTGLCGIWIVVLLLGALLNNGHPYNIEGLIFFGIFFIPSYFIYELIFRLRLKKANKT
jgi:hypothetical protein